MSVIEQIFCESMDIIVNKAIEEANYDRTIRCQIMSCVDADIGKYKIKYQDSVFYAYSNNIDIKYLDNSDVYILYPANNSNEDKTIIGSVKNLGIDYLAAISDIDRYVSNGVNCINPNKSQIGISSYAPSPHKLIIYDKTDINSILNINLDNVEEYLKTSDHIAISADFQTSLQKEQQYKGDFGITFVLEFLGSDGVSVSYKSHTIDVDSMTGTPYLQLAPTNQIQFFEHDKEAFNGISQIYLFSSNFPNTLNDYENDIFISNISIQGMTYLNDSDVNTYNLSLLAPKGTFFSTSNIEDKEIYAELKYKGSILGSGAKTISYYWFKENEKITSNSLKYSSLAGKGWECLNEYNELEGENLIDWIAATNTLKISAIDVIPQELTYKCIAVYDTNSFSAEMTIKNRTSVYDITIESDEGTVFYLNQGSPTLTCKVNGAENLTYSYLWSVIDSSNFKQVLNDDISGIDVEYNKINSINLGVIKSFLTFECRVFAADNTYIGKENITLVNNDETDTDYSLFLNDGSQLFKYNESGVSPTSILASDTLILKELSFSLLDDQGAEISLNSSNSTITWEIPNKKTMLVIDGQDDDNEDDFIYLSGMMRLSYNLLNNFNFNYTNNTIKLQINYEGKIFQATTDFFFLKEGQGGTNGDELTYNIAPNTNDNTVQKIIATKFGNTVSLNYTPISLNKWFTNKLWIGGEQILNSVDLDATAENGEEVLIEYSNMLNNYTYSISDESNIIINDNTITVQGTDRLPSNIIKGKLTYQKNIVYDFIPINTVDLQNNDYDIDILGGFSEVIYNTDGTSPKYSSNEPFEIKVLKNNLDVSLTNSISYSFSIVGEIYQDGWKNSEDLLVNQNSELRKNQYEVRPYYKYDGHCLNNGVKVEIRDNGILIATVYIPVYMYINRYSQMDLNEWNGNTIQIDEEGGIILSPQIGAGIKESDNTFTGLTFGKTLINGQDKNGMIGFYHGEQTLFLDAETGKSTFGSSGNGQVIIDPTDRTARLYGGNYSDSNKTGMLIDLTTPLIKWANGNFSVDADGIMRCTNGVFSGNVTASSGSIAGYTIDGNSLIGNQVGMNGVAGGNYAFWAGSNTSSSAPFRVDHTGELYSTSGTIGGWNITSSSLQTGAYNTNGTRYFGSNGLSLGTAFKVSSSGALSATGVNISGAITATSGSFTGTISASGGTIGGYQISQHTLIGSNVGISSLSGYAYAFWAGNNNSSVAPFRVGHDGTLYATKGNFSGSITGATGTFSGTLSTTSDIHIGQNLYLAEGSSNMYYIHFGDSANIRSFDVSAWHQLKVQAPWVVLRAGDINNPLSTDAMISLDPDGGITLSCNSLHVSDGDIVGRGSNSNGTYTRYYDGTQICIHRFDINPIANTTTSATWTFPSSFSSVSQDYFSCVVTPQTSVPYTAVQGVGSSDFTTTSAKIYLRRTNSTATAVSCIAIGRWK